MKLTLFFSLFVFCMKVPPSPFAASKPAPTRELSFEMVQAEDCEPNPQTSEEKSELFSRLEDALIKQIEVRYLNHNNVMYLSFKSAD